MKVAFIVTQFPTLSETFVLNQIVGLIDRGHEVDIFTHSRGSENLLQPEVRDYRLLERTVSLACPAGYGKRCVQAAGIAGRYLCRNPRVLLGSLNVVRYGRSAASLSLLYAAKAFDRRYDVVHAHFGMNGRLGAILKRLGLQNKLVVTFHGHDIRKGVEQGGRIYGELWDEVDCLIAISKYNYDHLVRLGGDPRRIVYHPVGIDCRRFVPKDFSPHPDGPIRLVSVARLVREKGLANAIRAVHEVLRRRPDLDVQYEIVGEGYLRSELQALIDDLGMSERIFLAGAGDQRTVRAALARSDIFLSSSIAEALPVSLMEAHAAGLPVIATRVGSVDQIVLDGMSGFLISPGDVDALAGKLLWLVGHRERWGDMGRAGRSHVEANFDVDRLNDRLVELYRGLLAA